MGHCYVLLGTAIFHYQRVLLSPIGMLCRGVIQFCVHVHILRIRSPCKSDSVKTPTSISIKWKLTLFMYSLSKSWRACRTALHSATMRSRRSSRVQDESAMSAAPLMMLSKRSSREGRKRASLNVRGSKMILFCWRRQRSRKLSLGTAVRLRGWEFSLIYVQVWICHHSLLNLLEKNMWVSSRKYISPTMDTCSYCKLSEVYILV